MKAIREGEVHLAYDTPFVYAEVNADEVVWLFGDGQAQEILVHNTSSVGKEISTKMVVSDQRQNITSSYKYPEGAWSPRHLGEGGRYDVFCVASQRAGSQLKPSPPSHHIIEDSYVALG